MGVKAPTSQSLTLLRTEQKLGLGERDLARGPVFSLPPFCRVLVAAFLGPEGLDLADKHYH